MGVVVRRYIDILTIIINFIYSTCISSFFGSSIPTSLFIFKTFFRSLYIYDGIFHYTFNCAYCQNSTTDTQTHTHTYIPTYIQDNYCNPRCACVLRVNYAKHLP